MDLPFVLQRVSKKTAYFMQSQNVDKPYQSLKIALLKIGYYIVETLRNADIMLFLRVFYFL